MNPIETGLSVILPVCGQTQPAEKAIPAWLTALERLSLNTELIVIHDTPLPESLLSQVKEGPHRFVLISAGEKKGYGHSLQLGVAASQYSLMFLTGLDQPFPIAEIGKLIHEINFKTEEGTIIPIDVVNFHRKGGDPTAWDRFCLKVRSGLERLILGTWPLPKLGWLPKSERWIPRAMRLWYGIRVHDPASRHKLIRRRILEKFIIQSQGEFATREVLAKANFLGAMIGEIVVPDRPSPFEPQPIQEPDTHKADEKEVWNSPKFVIQLPPKSEPVETKTEPISPSV